MPGSVFLIGPTCVGKSTIAIELAKRINAEIVSCDSMQVYRGMDIGTAKPTPGEQMLVPHHMIDIVDLTREYNVAQYVRDANIVIDKIKEPNKIPLAPISHGHITSTSVFADIEKNRVSRMPEVGEKRGLVTGGTGLYFKALIDGLFTGPSRDEEIRNRLEERVRKEGVVSLYNALKKLDPVSSFRIKPQDKRRIIRALEVFYITGKPISSFQTQWTEKKAVFVIGLNRQRGDLYKRIDNRVEDMFKRGFISEVRQLIGQGLTKNKTASQALGYREVLDYLSGRYTLDDAKELIKRNTRHFAKRQLTWFRKDDRVKWLLIQEGQGVDNIIQKILGMLKSV